MPNHTMLKMAAALTLLSAATVTVHAQDAGALVDKLVKKGILNDQEAEEVRADMTRDFGQTSAGKINLSSSITELKFYGDLRMRYQYDDRQSQVASPAHVSQRDRFRFRLRLGADWQLTDGWFAGVQLQTGPNADSANQTFTQGFDNYNIYISKAFLGWKNDWATVILGKQKNPFYTTDLVWDPDVTPQGAVEQIAFHKLFGGSLDNSPATGGYAKDSGYSKDGKSMAPAAGSSEVHSAPNWELTLVGGQFIFFDNNEFNVDSDTKTDSWLFVEQLIGTYRFNSNVSLTFAPGFMAYSGHDSTGLLNENSFNAPLGVGSTRDLEIITAPGDLSFKIAGLPAKFYWDFALNTNGKKRFNDIYALAGIPGDAYGERDSIAWLVGFQLGETKKKGDWALFANYRETGIAAVDPNLNDSDFAIGELNTKGWKVGLAYQLADAVVINVTGYQADNLRRNLVGGQATGGQAVAQDNSSNVLQVDLNVKF